MRPQDTEGFGRVGSNGVKATPTLSELHTELTAAMNAHAEANTEEAAARSKMTAAINRLNAAQKALDAAVDGLRKDAPWNTDWHSKRNRGEPVTS